MNWNKIISLLFCYLMAFSQHILAQYGGVAYYANLYGGIYGRLNGYPLFGYYPQYPILGSSPCYTSVYCGSDYGVTFGYSGYPFFQNSYNTAFSSSSSSGFSASYGLYGGFFG